MNTSNKFDVIDALSNSFFETDAGLINFGLADYVGKVPGMVHRLVDASVKEGTFTLDNFSKWTSSNIEMVSNWKGDDELFITQNQAFFSIYRFALVNRRLGKAVPISLFREPLPIDGKMFFILKIDLSNDLVILSGNGIEYSVCSNDHGTLRKFSENDRVILGFNSSDKIDVTNVDTCKHCLLINTTCNSFVRASPLRES
jgi:hypothetical protein